MDLSTVHELHMAINNAHRFIYFVPEAAEEYAALGVTGRGGYFGSRSAPMGAVTEPVVLATFFNFSPVAVAAAKVADVWVACSPEALQEARFVAAGRAMDRVGYAPSPDDMAEARRLIDPVVAALDNAGKPLAAANAAVALPDDERVAFWQQVTTIREWRGDAHIAVLQAAGVSPCQAVVLQVASGRVKKPLASTRAWNDEQWAAAVAALAARGWIDDDGALTDAGVAGREGIEADTDRLCAPIWGSMPEAVGVRLTAIVTAMNDAFVAAGTYAALG